MILLTIIAYAAAVLGVSLAATLIVGNFLRKCLHDGAADSTTYSHKE